MIAEPKIAKTLLPGIDIGSAGNSQQGRGGDDRLEHAILHGNPRGTTSHFQLRMRRVHSKAAGKIKKTGGSAFAPQTMPVP
jgi:hypothetical protein